MDADILSIKDALIISDPPYNIKFNYPEYSDELSEVEYRNLFEKFVGMRCVFIHYPEDTIKYIIPVLGFPKKVVSWVYNSNLKRQHRMISWFNCSPDFSKIKQPYKNLKDKRILKRIAEGHEGSDIYDWWEIDLIKNVSSEKSDYTNQIPEEVINRIIKITAEKEIIVDPFCGTGTTCVVAEKLGFNWIGLDISKKATEIAIKRINTIKNNLFN